MASLSRLHRDDLTVTNTTRRSHFTDTRAIVSAMHAATPSSVPCSAAFNCLRSDVTLPWTFFSSKSRPADEAPVEETKQLVLSFCCVCLVQAFKAFKMKSVLCSNQGLCAQDKTRQENHRALTVFRFLLALKNWMVNVVPITRRCRSSMVVHPLLSFLLATTEHTDEMMTGHYDPRTNRQHVCNLFARP